MIGSKEFKENKLIALQYVSVKKTDGELELHISNQSQIWNIVKDPDSLTIPEIEQYLLEWIRKKVIPLDHAKIEFNQIIKGMITEIAGVYEYEKEGQIELMMIFIMEDPTGAMKVSLFEKRCLELFNLTNEEKEQIVKMTPLERIDSVLIANKVNTLIGREIIVRGTMEENEYTSLLELKVNRFYPIQMNNQKKGDV